MVSQFQNSSSVRRLLNNNFLLLLLLSFLACSSPEKKTSDISVINSLTTHASLLKIDNKDSVWNVFVDNPWQNTENTRMQYRFSEKEGDASFIKVPVKKIVCFSSSHVAFISALGEQEKISGVSGLRYICDSIVNILSDEGKITEVGYENNINFEFFVKEKPDVALIYGVGTEHAVYISRLEELGIKVIYIAEYLEETPLGRLEWIKLFGIMLGCYDRADSIFESRHTLYNNILSEKHGSGNGPSVFSGSPIGDNWYIPGGKSFMANLIKDAGGKYMFSNDTRNESFPLSFESAYKELINADVWINCDLPAEVIFSGSADSRYSSVRSAKKRNVWSNTAGKKYNGGNDFWESAVVNPDVLLKDLRSVFFPELYEGYNPIYYRKL